MERVDSWTGELSKLEYEKPCQSRFADKCPHCSEVYRRDAFAVLRAGLNDATDATTPFTFITFTAPGADVFGPTHQRIVTIGKKGRPYVRHCGCKSVHAEYDELIGTPLDPSTYRYDLAADYNAHASRLFAVTMQRLGRVVGRKLSYTRVAEFQTRGLIHYHVIVKGIVTERSVAIVVQGGRDLLKAKDIERENAESLRVAKETNTPFRKSRRRPTTSAVAHAGWSWGPQFDVQHILPGGKFGVGAYLVKLVGYAVKGTDTSANGPVLHRKKMQGAAVRTCTCDKGLDCVRGSHLLPTKDGFYQSASSDRFCRRHQLAYNGWGFRGHVLAFSRNWGMTFREVRAKRRNYAVAANTKSSRFIVWGWSVSSRGSPSVA
jgi:hypothetical protein